MVAVITAGNFSCCNPFYGRNSQYYRFRWWVWNYQRDVYFFETTTGLFMLRLYEHQKGSIGVMDGRVPSNLAVPQSRVFHTILLTLLLFYICAVGLVWLQDCQKTLSNGSGSILNPIYYDRVLHTRFFLVFHSWQAKDNGLKYEAFCTRYAQSKTEVIATATFPTADHP